MQRIITKIEYQKGNKSRVNVYADEEFLVGLPAITVLEERWKVGSIIDLAALNSIAHNANREDCWTRAVDYSTRSMTSRRDVRDYLEGKDYACDIIVETVQKLIEYGYLNDSDYIRAYIHDHATKWGAKKIAYELVGKGLDTELIEAQMSTLDQREACENIAKKYIKSKPNDASARQKLSNFLYGKGFELDLIKVVVATAWEATNED